MRAGDDLYVEVRRGLMEAAQAGARLVGGAQWKAVQTVGILGEARDGEGGFGPPVAVSVGQADDGVLPAEMKRDGGDGSQGRGLLGRAVNGGGGGLR